MQNSLSLLNTHTAEEDDVLFSIDIDLNSDAIAVTLYGELDISTGQRLLGAMDPFTRNGHTRVLVDLDRVAFIDSAGALAIIELSDWLARMDGWLEITACSEPVEKLFTMLGVPVPGVLRD